MKMRGLIVPPILLLSVLCLVQSQSSSVSNATTGTIAPSKSSMAPTQSSVAPNKSSVTPNKSSVTPTKSSSKAPIKPTVTPTPTPLTPGVDSYTYIVPDISNNTRPCLRMVVDVALNFTYFTSTHQNKSVWIRFQNTSLDYDILTVDVDHNRTYCDVSEPSANLTLKYVSKELVEPFYVTFTFIGDQTPGNQHWSSANQTVDFYYQKKLFPDNNENIEVGAKSLYTNTSLFDDTNKRVEFTRPYRCVSNQTLGGFEVLGQNTTVSLWIRKLEVQAFVFLDANGTFSGGNAARVCLLDNSNSGNEVVPIAVGVALAVLVIIVLLAYLVGRVRNKKKSSYEALK